MEIVNIILDLESIWVMAYAVCLFTNLIIWRNMIDYLKESEKKVMKIFLFVAFVLIGIVIIFAFIQCVRTQIVYDFGVLLSTAIPTIVFYISFLWFIGSIIASFRRKIMTRKHLFSIISSSYVFVFLMYSYSFANSSPCGILLTTILLIFVIIQNNDLKKKPIDNDNKQE